MADRVHLEVVTPTELVLETEADLVVVPGGDGDFGVLPGHAPLISTLRPGTIDVYEGDKIAGRVFVESGFVEVSPQGVSVVAEAATPTGDIDAKEAEARLNQAREARYAATTDVARQVADAEVAAAEAMLRAVQPAERH